MVEERVTINGMTCNHCVMAVKKELTKIPGLIVREVGIGSATVAFDPGKVSRAQIDAAVSEAGYAPVR